MINHPRRSKTATTSRASKATAHAHNHDLDYSALLLGVRRSFEMSVRGQTRLFTTDASGLWEKYLAMLPGKAERQVHNCHCCRRFIQTYGGLVGISAEGETWPVMWRANGVPDFYKPAFIALHQIVDKARVTGVFLTRAPTWGTPQSDGKGETWQHISVVPPAEFLHRDRAREPNQVAAALKQNTITVSYAMAEYTPAVLDEALRVLASETLERSEKFIGPVKWLRALHNWPKGEKNQQIRSNILWRAVATAPEGFCHIKSSVVGPLLDDIVVGVPFEDLKRKHAAKLHPLQYQRPQAAPSIGNVKAAEALVEKLGIAPSLERRFARFEELPLQDALWTWSEYHAAKPATGGVFGHIKTKDGRTRGNQVPSVNLPSITMTWDKFRRTVLSTAEQIECEIPQIGPFCALTTATHADAPPIMKWDREDERNPFSWYTYHRGSSASQWKLTAHRPAKVNAIVAAPGMWGPRPMPELGDGVFLILDGCADTRTGQGNAIFPEHLKSDLHGIRSTIEAYSKAAELTGREEASACGWPISKGNANVHLRVFSGNAWTSYHIDRWD